MAEEAGAYLEYVNGADVCGGYPGEGECRLRDLFEKSIAISEDGPCVLFIDEIDALCPQKGLCCQFLNESGLALLLVGGKIHNQMLLFGPNTYSL